LWCNHGDNIHQELIAFGMCTNVIPMEEKYSNYKWADSVESMDMFIALDGRASSRMRLAESYIGTVEKAIVENIQKNPKEYANYINFINRFDFNVSDLITQ
jgi:hypothetical protein